MNNAQLTLERQTPMYDGAYADKCVEVEVLVGGRKIPMAGYTDDELDVGEIFPFVLRDTTIILTSDSEGFRKVLRLHADRETGEFLAPETIYDESPDSVGAYLDGCRDDGADEGGHLCDVRNPDWREETPKAGHPRRMTDARCAWTHMTDEQHIEFLEWIGAERECMHGDVEYIIPLAAFAPDLPEELT